MASSHLLYQVLFYKTKEKNRKEGRKEEKSHQDPDTQTDKAGLSGAHGPGSFRNLSPVMLPWQVRLPGPV